MTWGTLAAVGVSALLAAKPEALVLIKIFGSIYLLYLSFKSLLKMRASHAYNRLNSNYSKHTSFLKGYGIHMSNPEAMMGWIAIISLGVNETSPELAPYYIVCGCVLIAIAIYSSYAYLFSSNMIANMYSRFDKIIEGIFASIFGFASVTLLMTVA